MSKSSFECGNAKKSKDNINHIYEVYKKMHDLCFNFCKQETIKIHVLSESMNIHIQATKK